MSRTDKVEVPIAPMAPIDLKQLFSSNTGIVIGENHSSDSSKKFLIQNFPTMLKMGYRVLFLEHLSQEKQHLIDEYYGAEVAPENMPGDLVKNLHKLDDDQMNLDRIQSTKNYGFLNIVKAAKKSGIRIVCLEESDKAYRAQKYKDRFTKFNSRVADVIARSANPDLKWLAFVGTAHVHNHASYKDEDLVPIKGIVEQLGDLGVQSVGSLIVFNSGVSSGDIHSEIFPKKGCECYYASPSAGLTEIATNSSIYEKMTYEEFLQKDPSSNSNSFNASRFLVLDHNRDLSFASINERDETGSIEKYSNPEVFFNSIAAGNFKPKKAAAADFSAFSAPITAYPSGDNVQFVMPPATAAAAAPSGDIGGHHAPATAPKTTNDGGPEAKRMKAAAVATTNERS